MSALCLRRHPERFVGDVNHRYLSSPIFIALNLVNRPTPVKLLLYHNLTLHLFCGRPIGRIKRVLPVLLFVRLSVCLSVRLSVAYGLVSRKQKKTRRRIKLVQTFLQGTSAGNANFQLKRSKVKVIGRQKNVEKLSHILHACLLYGRRLQTKSLTHSLGCSPSTRFAMLKFRGEKTLS